jgi:WhiB family redox-sensing transcriptional regulator
MTLAAYTDQSTAPNGLTDRSWMEHANCKGNTKLFFPPKAERPQARDRREAKAKLLCTQCVVRSQCQQYARINHEYGYWGGESEEDRHLAGFTVAAPIGVRARLSSRSKAS